MNLVQYQADPTTGEMYGIAYQTRLCLADLSNKLNKKHCGCFDMTTVSVGPNNAYQGSTVCFSNSSEGKNKPWNK